MKMPNINCTSLAQLPACCTTRCWFRPEITDCRPAAECRRSMKDRRRHRQPRGRRPTLSFAARELKPLETQMIDETTENANDSTVSGSRQERLVAALGKTLCGMGIHKWGEAYPTIHGDWFFGMAHHAQKCTRQECQWVRRFAP